MNRDGVMLDDVGFEALLDGHRVNLIVWCRSTRFRRVNGVPARCGAWCARPVA